MEQLYLNVKERAPLVHCITNYVTANDCANILLACGASPVMSDDPKEAADVTAAADATVINTGTLSTRTIPSMEAAAVRAAALGHPLILDPVGAGASPFRTDTIHRLLNAAPFTVIRGNLSEIRAILGNGGAEHGVDVSRDDRQAQPEAVLSYARQLNRFSGAVVVVTGAVDVVADQQEAYFVKNGHEMLAKITGAGCMLSAVTGAFCGANRPDTRAKACALACALFGYAGELARQKAMGRGEGTGSMRTYLLDFISLMDYHTLSGGMKIEAIT